MKRVLWVRSPEGWAIYSTYPTQEQGLSVGLSLLRAAQDWNPTPPVRLLAEGERPEPDPFLPKPFYPGS
jgi:hypothetical protein